MLSNAYFLAKIRFDTAENEPAKNLQNFGNLIIAIFTKFEAEAVRDEVPAAAEEVLHAGERFHSHARPSRQLR